MPSRSLSELSTLTGLKPRTLQFWAQSGVIIGESGTVHRGPGVHRKFPQIEAEIACILAELSPFSLQVGALMSISDMIRSGDAYGRTFASTEDALHLAKIESARRERQKINKSIYGVITKNFSEIELAEAAAPPSISDTDYDRLGVHCAMMLGRSGVSAILTVGFKDGVFIARGSSAVTWDTTTADELPASIWIQLDTILPKAQT